MPIAPQEKSVKRSFSIPTSVSEWLDTYAKSLNDSSPDYVVGVALQQFRQRETKAAAPRKTDRKTTKEKA